MNRVGPSEGEFDPEDATDVVLLFSTWLPGVEVGGVAVAFVTVCSGLAGRRRKDEDRANGIV